MTVLRRVLPYASAVVGAGGLVLIVGTINSPVGWMHLSESYVAPGAALLIGAITTAVAQLGLETVADKRAAAVDATTRQNRARIYEELLGHIIESFTFDGKTMSEAQARAKAVAWAGPEAYASLTDWFRYAAAQTSVYGDPSAEEILVRRELVYRVAARMREDLQSQVLRRSELLSLVFNDFDPNTPFPTEILGGHVDAKGGFVRGSRST